MGSSRLKKLRKREGKKQRNKKARQQAKRDKKQRSTNKRRRKNQRRGARNQVAAANSYAGYIPPLFAVPPVMAPVMPPVVVVPEPAPVEVIVPQNNFVDADPNPFEQNFPVIDWVDNLIDEAFFDEGLAPDPPFVELMVIDESGYGDTTSNSDTGSSSEDDFAGFDFVADEDPFADF